MSDIKSNLRLDRRASLNNFPYLNIYSLNDRGFSSPEPLLMLAQVVIHFSTVQTARLIKHDPPFYWNINIGEVLSSHCTAVCVQPSSGRHIPLQPHTAI